MVFNNPFWGFRFDPQPLRSPLPPEEPSEDLELLSYELIDTHRVKLGFGGLMWFVLGTRFVFFLFVFDGSGVLFTAC